MTFLSLLGRRGSARAARDRLQILLAHERSISDGTDLVGVLREEIIAVITRHVKVDPGCVMIKMERGNPISTLEVEIEIPTQMRMGASAHAHAHAHAHTH